MRKGLAMVLALALLAPAICDAATGESTLQGEFTDAMQSFQAGNLGRAEALLRDVLRATGSPRVKLELARTLFLEGRYEEAKSLFQEVARQSDTPWRVRDNIARFVDVIDERTGYLKLGATIVSDSNPRNLAAQREFSIGGLRVTPAEAPKKVWGLRYSARGWRPFEDPVRGAGYVAASYTDYPGADFDRTNVDFGLAKSLTASGRVRGKAGIELGWFGGRLLYQFPYLGLDAVVSESASHRVTAETKLGRIKLPEFGYQDATFWSGAVASRHALTPSLAGTLRSALEYACASERRYSYYGAELGPGFDWPWAKRAFLFSASATVGARRYGDVDPLFGKQRSDSKAKLELTVGNKEWRWRNAYVSLIASLEESRSTIEFFSYRRANLSVAVE